MAIEMRVLRRPDTNSVTDSRILWGLTIGTSENDAKLVGGEWMPSRAELPSVAQEITSSSATPRAPLAPRCSRASCWNCR